jgi:hypothetical protein
VVQQSIESQDGDSIVLVEGAIFKPGREEFEVQGSCLPPMAVLALIQTVNNSGIEHTKANISKLPTELVAYFQILTKALRYLSRSDLSSSLFMPQRPIP